ncbi:MAG: alpha-L-fucosidase [Prevotella sp.]|nr:alpha-L-fucosidase [Candidatus Prevotella equi]
MVSAQYSVHEVSPSYVWPTDQKVLDNLHKWQDLKFGILIHWGLYSVMGRCESWELTIGYGPLDILWLDGGW